MAGAEVTLALKHIHKLVAAETAEQASDHLLLQGFVRARDEEAFTALVQRHGGMVLGVCRRVLSHQQDAEDAFQATFLILAKKAASLRRTDSVGGWLHRVACRLALKARAGAARQRHRDSHGTPTLPVDPTAEISSKELRTVLDEALQQLPDKYRAPLVLCYLEGKTQEEAARQLAWSKGTLRRRLGQGRELLRQRLVRRGLAPATALAASLLADHPAAAAAPAELVRTTVRAALEFATGKTAAGLVPAPVAALAEGGLTTLCAGKLKTATALLAAVIVAGVGLWTCRVRGASERAAPPPQSRTPEKPAVGGSTQRRTADATDEAERIEVNGRVLDPDGKPVAGARVYCFRSNLVHLGYGGIWYKAYHGTPATGTSGPDGRFRFRVSKAKHKPSDDRGPEFEATVAAVASGHGPAWTSVGRPEGLKDLTLKLVKDDVPIRGRILDLEGKPIKGVTVCVESIVANDKEDLTPWRDFFQKKKDASPFWEYLGKSLDPVVVGLAHTATTGADGHFRLRGLGRERLLSLRFEGPTIESQIEYVMTRPGQTGRVPATKSVGEFVLHGATFDHVAKSSRPVIGIVRDRDTGKPLAGVRIVGALGKKNIQCTTDRQGRYRLIGLPSRPELLISADPAPGQLYLACTKRTSRGTAQGAVRLDVGPVRLDFGLKRGLPIRGRVTDKVTGKPVRATVTYFAFFDNPHLDGAPGYNGSHGTSAVAAPDGSFTVVGLPGRGLLAAKAPHPMHGRYIAGAGAEKIKGIERDQFSTTPSICDTLEYNTLVEINSARDAKSIACDIVLEPGKTVTGTVVGPDGKPLEGVQIKGWWRERRSIAQEPPSSARFTITGINARVPRPFFFLHPEKRLAAAVLLKGDEPGGFPVRLRPCATVTGRLLDAGGAPLAGVLLGVGLESGQFKLMEVWGGGFGVGTDKAGRFRIDTLIPNVRWGGKFYRDHSIPATVFEDVSLRPGAVKDLGDIRIKPHP